MDGIVTKCCTKCKQVKPLTDFYDKSTQCKTCIIQGRKEKYVPKPPKHPPVPEGHKWCSHCQQMLAATTEFFYSNKGKSDGLSTLCKICHIQYEKSRHEKPKIVPPTEIVCYECGQTKPVTDFARKRATVNGVDTMCKKCRSAERKGYYYGNFEFRARLLATCKIYRKTRIEEERETKRRWYQANKDLACRYKRMYRKREHVRERRRIEYHNRRARKRNAPGTYTKEDIRQQYKRQKGKCYWCGTDLKLETRPYHVDHIVPLSRGGSNWPDNLVIACHTCNESRNNKLPHEWPRGGRLL